MFAVVCPHCSASLDVEPRGVGQPIDCPNCGGAVLLEAPAADQPTATYHAPVPHAPLVASLPPRTSPAPRRPLLIGGCSCLLVIALGAPCLVGMLVSGKDSRSHGGLAVEKDPYSPDCRIVRDYLRGQYGEVEIVSWGKRSIHRDLDLGGHVTLTARFRCRGERKVRSGFFIIGPGDILETASIQD